jgi:hypothetical protein
VTCGRVDRPPWAATGADALDISPTASSQSDTPRH